MDASVIPRSLGVNPLLTITGLAERACALLAADHGWTIPYDGEAPAPVAEPPRRVDRVHRADGRMDRARHRGRRDPRRRTSPPRTAGEQAGTPAEFLLTIVADGVVQFIEDPARPAIAFGTVTAPGARRRAADRRRR